jgi:hypothetical protein
MLFKFKSKAASDLIILEPDARALLLMMLGDDPVKGIVLAQDIPAAITRLESALAQEAAKRQAHKQSEGASGQGTRLMTRMLRCKSANGQHPC